MSLRLQLLEEELEPVEAGLAHPEKRVGAVHLTEVWSSVAAASAEDVDLAEHVLNHEVLSLLRQGEGKGERVVERERGREREGVRNHHDCSVRSASEGKAEHAQEETGKRERRQTAKQSPCCPINKSHRLTGLSPFSPLFIPQRLLLSWFSAVCSSCQTPSIKLAKTQ